ncbi:hypothetical protein [Kitasatospora sp. NPDC096140]|uniref:hypothetical protein n=1 Tax=Kitasatospora sp. NPDC096140 TaxID=3155425 RepID=UPI00332439C5
MPEQHADEEQPEGFQAVNRIEGDVTVHGSVIQADVLVADFTVDTDGVRHLSPALAISIESFRSGTTEIVHEGEETTGSSFPGARPRPSAVRRWWRRLRGRRGRPGADG